MKTLHRIAAVGLIVGLGGLLVNANLAAGGKDGVAVGDKAPKFSAKDETGKVWNSQDHVGKKVIVVYFYPADMTGGCTKQACAFRDDFGKLKDMGVEVVGVSGDTVGNHMKFKKAENLNFTLLADTEGDVAEAFGVPYSKGGKAVTKTIDGTEYNLDPRGVTTKRWTFVIGRDGTIIHKDTEVNAAQDSKNIMKAIQGK